MPQDKNKPNPFESAFQQPPTPLGGSERVPTSSNPFEQEFITPTQNRDKILSRNPFEQEFQLQESQKGTIGETLGNKFAGAISSIPGAQATISTIAPALDIVSRPSYAVSRFIDSFSNQSKTALDSVAEAFTELFGSGDSRKKLSMSDVIRRNAPQFALESPNATQVIGFIGDIALDPTSWLGVGTVKNGIQVGGKTLTKGAATAVKEFIPSATRKVFVAADGTLEVVESLPKITEKAKRVEKLAESFEQRAAKSVVVDDAGELLPLYYGTESPDFKSFKTKGDVDGVYFTTDPNQANIYSGPQGRVIKAYSTADNVLDLNNNVPTEITKLANKLQVIDPTTTLPFTGTESTIDIVNAIRNKLNADPLDGQKALVKELKKIGYKGISFMSDDGGSLAKQFLIFNSKDIELAYTSKGLRAQEKVAKGTYEIGKLNKATETLETQGYFDEVIKRQDEISKFLNNLSDSPKNPELANALAKSEIIGDLETNLGTAKPRDILYENEVTERLYQRIGKLVETRPETFKQIFEPKGVYLKIGVPFGKQRDVLRIFGLEGISNKIKSLSTYINTSESLVPKGLAMLGRAFDRDFGLPKEYIKFRNELENELGYLSDEMVRNTRKLFKDIKPDGRERIGNAMHYADDETRKLEEIRQASSDPNFRTLTDGEAAQIFQESMDKFKLTPEEKAVALSIQQSYKEAAVLEMRAGLLKGNLLNYSARGYEIIDKAEDMSIITRGKYGSSLPQPYLASSKARKFLTKAEAEAAGLVPELDAALLYAHRVLSSQRALATNRFKESVIELFGSYSDRGKIAHTGILPTTVLDEALPKNIIADMKMIGDSVYPSNYVGKSFLKGFDRLQGMWKRGATTLNPAFGPKQLVSNTFQAAMVIGTKAFKVFDPRVAIDSAILLMRGGKPLENLPPFLTNFISKHFTGNNGLDGILASRTILQRHFDDTLADSFVANFKKTTALGQTFTGQELVDLAHQKGIIRGFDSTGEAFSRKVESEITKDANSYARVAGTLTKVWNHAAMIEDYSRMNLFLNGIGMGLTADDAAKLVNKALFDYQRGLSFIEKNVIRRILPFYTFQRFAIPSVLKSTLKQPGNVATLDKLMRTTEKLLLTGEELNPAEIDTFNETGDNYILEQPRLLSGFDKNGTATLNLLNNLTPFDALNLLTYDKEGNIDISRTADKTFFAALTPFLKIPLTLNAQRDFFTDRTIQEASKLPGSLDQNIGKVIPQAMKDLMSWEVRKNEVTGKISTYINPFISYYSMQFIPSLRAYVKPVSEVDIGGEGWLWSSVNAAMKLISPVSQKQVDLQEMNQYQMLNADKDINDIIKSMVGSKIRGNKIGTETSLEYEENLKNLQEYMQTLGETSKARAAFQIRGQGIGGAITPNANVTGLPEETKAQVPSQQPAMQSPNFR